MSNTATNNNNNINTSNNNESASGTSINKHDIKTVHNDIFVPPHDKLNQRGIVGSKNKYVHEEIDNPILNFGHEVHVIPQQMNNEMNPKKSIHPIMADDDSGCLADKRVRPMSAANLQTHDQTIDKERGRERVVHTNVHCEDGAPSKPQPPVFDGEAHLLSTEDRLHHHSNDHKPQKEQQDAKWWRREIRPTQHSAPFEDLRSVPTHNEYDCSGRCSNNVYDVHNHEQTRGAYNWHKQGDDILASNKVNIN